MKVVVVVVEDNGDDEEKNIRKGGRRVIIIMIKEWIKCYCLTFIAAATSYNQTGQTSRFVNKKNSKSRFCWLLYVVHVKASK